MSKRSQLSLSKTADEVRIWPEMSDPPEHSEVLILACRACDEWVSQLVVPGRPNNDSPDAENLVARGTAVELTPPVLDLFYDLGPHVAAGDWLLNVQAVVQGLVDASTHGCCGYLGFNIGGEVSTRPAANFFCKHCRCVLGLYATECYEPHGLLLFRECVSVVL